MVQLNLCKEVIKINKCIKVVIKNCNELTYKDMNKSLGDIRYTTCKASNKAMQMYYLWEHEKLEYKNKYGEYPKEQEQFGKTYRNVVEGEMKRIMNNINTSNVGQTNAFVMKKWNTDKKDIFNNKKSVANYKQNMPIYLKNNSYKISQTEHGLEIDCAIYNKKQDLKHLTFTLEKLNGNEKATLNKIINGEYKQGSVQICQSKKGKWEILISFGFETKIKDLSKERILGLDMGIVNAITMQIWDNIIQDWERLSWSKCVLDGKELIHLRQKIYARRIDLLRNSKLPSLGNSGHGRKTKIKSIATMSHRVDNFRDTLNHKYSKYVIDFAIKNNCGVIQVEDLAGYSENVDSRFLKSWSYYDLQAKIKYKAEENGIEFKLINPYCTSLRCSKCGCISKENRDCKKNQAKFKCLICDNSENADINAAKNISLPDIEEIIKKQLKLNKE